MIQVPLLAHSILKESSPGAIITPDWHLIATNGFSDTLDLIQSNNTPLELRAPMVYWRGSSTGVLEGPRRRHCFGLKRIQVCNASKEVHWVDAKISRLTQWCNKGHHLERHGLMASLGSDVDWLKYRGIFEIDGNVNAWGHFWRLRSGSLVFKIESDYTSFLDQKEIPGVHYISIQKNLSNLAEVTAKITDDANLPFFQRVISNAKELTAYMTLENEIFRVAHELSSVWRINVSFRNERSKLS